MSGKPKPTNYRMSLGLRIKKYREKRFSTAKECAEKYDVSPSMWTDMEKGRVVFSPEKIIELARFLNVSAGWLLTGEESEEKAPAGAGARLISPDPELFDQLTKAQALFHQLYRRVMMGQFEAQELRRILLKTSKEIETELEHLGEGQESI